MIIIYQKKKILLIRYIKYGRIFELYLSIGIIISLILSFLFNIKVNNLISFYSMILPFVFALIIGIKSLMFIVNKDDFKDEKTIKNNLNEIAEDIFKRLFFFFVISSSFCVSYSFFSVLVLFSFSLCSDLLLTSNFIFSISLFKLSIFICSSSFSVNA